MYTPPNSVIDKECLCDMEGTKGEVIIIKYTKTKLST